MVNKKRRSKKNKKEFKIDKKTNEREFEKEFRTKRRKKIIKSLFLIIFILVIILGIKTAISINKWKSLVQDMMANSNSQVIDINGNIIAELGSEKKKEKIDSSKIPQNLKNAYIAIEDQRFNKHHGVDIKRTTGAVVNYIINFGSSSFGGSTITQQLVKNLTGDDANKISRKVKEWVKAFELETFLSKDEILGLYLNIIYIGPNMYGVETGANYYFNKSVTDLNLAQMAFLAGINHSPNSYNPFGNKDNSEKINKRTKTVLAKMLELEYINESEYDDAIKEVESGLKFKEGNIESNNIIYSYHTDALTAEVISDISDKKKISTSFATNYINMSGLRIYSTQNTEIQKQIEREFEKNKYILKSNNEQGKTSQAAMVIIDHKTGYVVGCVGGLGEKTDSRGLNRVTQTIRQTGSAGKPISVLGPALQEKIITAASIYDDSETIFENGYTPTDYDPYKGEITVRRAVESSQNIPFVKIMEELTPETSIKYMKKMGITTLTKEDNNLVLALGGLERGISPLQMAGAYATIANNGKYIEPTFYRQITNSSGSTILETKQKTKRVFSEEVSYILKELLKEPVEGLYGTATYCKISGMDVAAKTGTTDENYDRWLCGFTPYYTAVTWYGFDLNETINYSGKNPAGLLWASIMKKVHSKLKNVNFIKPSGVVETKICADTGKVANNSCKNTYTEYFLKGTVPEMCTRHSGGNTTTTKNKNTTIENKTTKNITTNSTKNTNQTKSNTTSNKVIEDITVEDILLDENYIDNTTVE